MRFHVVVVSHNSQAVLPVCLAHLRHQRLPPARVTVVDSGSHKGAAMERLVLEHGYTSIRLGNVGFARANNIGVQSAARDDFDGTAFVNPDAFMPPSFLERSATLLTGLPQVAVISGKLLRYDPVAGQPLRTIDSTGVFQRWYGRWYDRGQGEEDAGQYDRPEDVPALCGALLVCRNEAIATADGQVFDEDFFLYKEDIELSLRLRKRGWRLRYQPELVAYHCRGWQSERAHMPYQLKIAAAISELTLYRKHPSPRLLWAVMKYFAVRFLRI